MIFTDKVIDFTREPLFFGSGRNIARVDLDVFPEIRRLYEKLRAQLWFPTDFSLKQDAADYLAMSKEQQILFLKNLKFQTLLDSLATRTVLEIFMPITTNPQLEEWWVLHGFTESIHSNSYAEIIKALPVDAKAIFDDIMINPEILQRAEAIIEVFNDTVLQNAMILTGGRGKGYDYIGYIEDAHKASFLKSLYGLNILEGGLFQSSFITSFAFAENGIMEGTSKIIAKISNDEGVHCEASFYLLAQLRSDPAWAHIFHEVENDVIQMYRTAYEADLVWVDYLFPDNSQMLGLNAAILQQYVTFNMYNLLKAVGIEPFIDPVRNPVTWSSKYTDISKQQIAQNESDGNSYLLGVINKDMSKDDWNEVSEVLGY